VTKKNVHFSNYFQAEVKTGFEKYQMAPALFLSTMTFSKAFCKPSFSIASGINAKNKPGIKNSYLLPCWCLCRALCDSVTKMRI